MRIFFHFFLLQLCLFERFPVSAKSKNRKNQHRLNRHQREQLDTLKNNHFVNELEEFKQLTSNTFHIPKLTEDQYLSLIAKCKGVAQHTLCIAILKDIDDQLIAESNCYADFINQKKIILSNQYDIDNDLLIDEITYDNVCRYLYDNCTSTKIKDKGFDNLELLFADNRFAKQQLKNKNSNIYSIEDITLRQVCDLRIWFCLQHYYPSLQTHITKIITNKYHPDLLGFLNQVIDDCKVNILKSNSLVVKSYDNYQAFLNEIKK